VGLAAIMAARVVGCAAIIALDLNEARLKIAKELGATHSIQVAQCDPAAAIREIASDGVQYSIECTGNPAVVRQAVECLRLTGVAG